MNKDIEQRLHLPLWQMTGHEFVTLHHYALSVGAEKESIPPTHTNTTNTIMKTGVRELAAYLSCCESTLYSMKREGVLDAAIISHIGKSIVFDAEKARTLAQEFKAKQHPQR